MRIFGFQFSRGQEIALNTRSQEIVLLLSTDKIRVAAKGT